MRCFFAILALLCAPAAPAHAADDLTCAEQGFAKAAADEVEAFQARFGIAEVLNPSLPPAIVDALHTSVVACWETYRWPVEKQLEAVKFLGAQTLLEAVERNIPLSPEQIAQLRANYAAADMDRLRAELGDTDATARPYLTQIGTIDGLRDTYEEGAWIAAFLISLYARDEAQRLFGES